MNSSTSVIIGGGVIGLSTAYHLALKQFGRIIVLEKESIGDGSSSRAAGFITGLLWSETGVLARKKSLELFQQLSQELTGYQFQGVGCLNLFDQQSWPDREKLLPLYKRLDFPFEILSPAEMHRRWPELTPPDEFIGLLDPLGGYSEPHEYIPALTQKLRSLGVEIRERETVTDFLIGHGRVTGVETASGRVEGDVVICTVHAWAHAITERLGLPIPMKSFVHQRYVTHPLPAPVKIPAINANPLEGYIRPASGNRMLAGIETSEREEYHVASTDFRMPSLSTVPELQDHIMRDFSLLTPDLANTSWESEKVGLIAFSVDGEPILGPLAQIPGLYVGFAFHSGGFAYNPVAGFLLAEFVADGQTHMDVSAFSPDRFEQRDVDVYLATVVAQKEATQRRH